MAVDRSLRLTHSTRPLNSSQDFARDLTRRPRPTSYSRLGRHRNAISPAVAGTSSRYDSRVSITVTPVPGKPALLLGAFDIASLGYVAEEFFISGPASSYSSVAELGPDGRWSAEASGSAEFTTRMVALTPADPARFNGTVLVEWLNVSGGIDAPAVWMMAHREMVRAGYAYVAVSAQRVGVEGGTNLIGVDMSLKSQDPQRYATLRHPGDAFAYDIYSQAGRIVRDAHRTGVLRELRAEHVIALGESQSALFLTTYINAVDPLARVYDGFLVHSRFGPAAPLDGGSIFHVLGRNASLAGGGFSAFWTATHRSRWHFARTSASRWSPSSPKQISSVVRARAITARDSLKTNNFGSGRSPEPRTPTTTRFKWHRSTPALRH